MTSDINYILINTASDSSWTDDVPAIASGVIALLALATTLYQLHLFRKHNRLSVRPHLSTHTEEVNDIYKITIRNDGLGPATIDLFSIYEHNILLQETGDKLITRAFKHLSRCNITELEAINLPYVLPANQAINLVTLNFDSSLDSIEDYLEGHLRLKVGYKSMYGEKFSFQTS